jgi:hypothetical protein
MPMTSIAASDAPSPVFAEDEEAHVAVVTLPLWRGYPLSGKPLTEVELVDLEVLYSQLRVSAPEQYVELLAHITLELDGRRAAID